MAPKIKALNSGKTKPFRFDLVRTISVALCFQKCISPEFEMEPKDVKKLIQMIFLFNLGDFCFQMNHVSFSGCS